MRFHTPARRAMAGGAALAAFLTLTGTATANPPTTKQPIKPHVHAGATTSSRSSIAYSASVTVQPRQYASADAFCPTGTLATGGGESNSSLGGVTLTQTLARADGSGWEAQVYNGDATESYFNAYAVCWSGLTSYSIQRATAPASSSNWTSVVANCPDGQVILGGGGFKTSSSGRFSHSFVYGQHGWVVDMIGAPLSAFVTSQAVCGTGFSTRNWGNSGGLDQWPAGQLVGREEPCAAGTSVIGGGFDTDNRDGQPHGGPRTTDSYPLGDGSGWEMYAYTDEAGTVAPTVVCGA